MTKQQQFLFMVQTTIIANAVNLSTMPDEAVRYRADMSATGVLGTTSDALYASERIPDDMDAAEAAGQFCGFMLNNLREIENKVRDQPLQCPSWFARG